jgi:predicted PolB exonuclease-like 3'-5' exonuclease
MFDRPLVAFDIETIPDPEIGRRVMNIEGDDHAVVLEMVRRRQEESKGAQKYPQQPWHRVVCICATVLDPKTGTIEMRTLGSDPESERSIIDGFFDLFAPHVPSPRLVSWNGNGFDLPVLRYRGMKHGIAAPGFYRAGADRYAPSYVNRYHDLHVDVMDVLSGYGASARAGLGTTCDLLDLPGKSFLEREVYEHWFAGEHRRVVEYCKLDTLETLLVFLAWSVHNGSLAHADLAAYVPRIRELVAAQDYPAWADVGARLAAWPAWMK